MYSLTALPGLGTSQFTTCHELIEYLLNGRITGAYLKCLDMGTKTVSHNGD